MSLPLAGVCLLYSFIYLFILQYWGLNLGPTPQATPPALYCDGFYQEMGLKNYLPWLALNHDPPYLCFLSS
jgi:hypothetical protein